MAKGPIERREVLINNILSRFIDFRSMDARLVVVSLRVCSILGV